MGIVSTAGIGLLTGILKSAFSAWFENKRIAKELDLARQGIALKDFKSAREMQDPSAQWSRRFMMIIFTLCLVAAPTLYAWTNPEATITIPKYTVHGGFFAQLIPFVDPVKEVEYITVPVMVLHVMLLEMYGLIVGFYFGHGGHKK